MTSALRVSGLEKSYGKLRLGPIDFEVTQGSVTGFIGSNGAGKSTTLNCIMGAQTADAGEILVNGRPARLNDPSWRQNIGFVLTNQGFYDDLSAAQNLKFYASCYENWDSNFCMELLQRLKLDPKKKVKSLSTGDKAKLAFISAISHRPKLLILDEPTSGMDVVARSEFIDILANLLRDSELSMIISTHILSEVAALADQLTFIHEQKIVLDVPKDEFLDSWRRISFRSPEALNDIPSVVKVEKQGSLYLATSKNIDHTMQFLRSERVEILDSHRMNLEEISTILLA